MRRLNFYRCDCADGVLFPLIIIIIIRCCCYCCCCCCRYCLILWSRERWIEKTEGLSFLFSLSSIQKIPSPIFYYLFIYIYINIYLYLYIFFLGYRISWFFFLFFLSLSLSLSPNKPTLSADVCLCYDDIDFLGTSVIHSFFFSYYLCCCCCC